MAWYFDTGTTSEDISNPECMSYLLALVVLHVCVKGFQTAHVQGIGMHISAKEKSRRLKNRTAYCNTQSMYSPFISVC
jgi:hypothetical protein